MFTLTQNGEKIAMRNIQLKANGFRDLNKQIKEHEGDFIIIKNNQIMNTNCQRKNYEF